MLLTRRDGEFLFCVRVPLVSFGWLVWLAIIQWTPPGGVLRKANLWYVLGIPGVWWIDIQVDGVRRGSLSATRAKGRLPAGSSIIASSHTSPLDILYLGAIFDPIFTQSTPNSRLVQPLSLEAALASVFSVPAPAIFHTRQAPLTLAQLTAQNPDRTIVVFPETITSNGRAILPLAPSLLSASPTTRIYPVSLRYTPADIVTPIPGWTEVARFIWRLNSRPTHCIRVRVGGALTLASLPPPSGTLESPSTVSPRSTGRATGSSATSTTSPAARRSTGGYETNYFDTLHAQKVPGDTDTDTTLSGDGEADSEGDAELSQQERRVLDAVAEALARLGRVKRVGLGAKEKDGFVKAWWGRSRARK
ncbi:Lysophosphatidic acid:oleoyl-CoA acyltransferase 1 [Saxophila tyrrhenica]|uniref:Lysophosphatidic acid:oleoyl-CoA acyltransferase 1 n=1 Tax=Saxophila tyrrhenica TaxID=1690608 RepID=A0AAV9PPM2_9PEZI|nr:Lysophosphatidic acid:oleoyl-CoA acyltransferase 1 [Saxophila tyrrhenica]